MDLKKETQKNLLIVFGLTIFDKMVIFSGLVVLARLLKPEDFGLMAVAEILIAFVVMWQEHIFETSSIAISKIDDFDTTLSIAFLSRAVLSLFLYAILYAISGLWASFYNDPSLSIAIKLLGLNIIISNLVFVPNTTLVKAQRFDKLIVPSLLKNPTHYITSIILAIAGFGFWSLVLGRIVSHLIVAASFFLIKPWKARLVWDRVIFSTMFNYARTMYIYMLSVFFITQIDKFVVSKFLGLATVGYYVMAYSLGNWVISNIFAVADRVAFPLYVGIRDDSALLKAAYLKFFKYILFLSVPLLTGLMLFAEYFVLVFLGAKWLVIVTPLRILSLAGFFGLIGNISNSILKGINRLEIDVKRNFVLSIVLLTTLVPLTIRYGLIGSCVSVLISFAIVQPLYFGYAIKTIDIGLRDIARGFLTILGSSLCGVTIYILCDRLFLKDLEWMLGKFCLSILSYASAYLLAAFVFMHRELITDIEDFFAPHAPRKARHLWQG